MKVSVFSKTYNRAMKRYVSNSSPLCTESDLSKHFIEGKLKARYRGYKVPLSHIKSSKLLLAWIYSLKNFKSESDLREHIARNVFSHRPLCVADVLGIEKTMKWHELGPLHTVYPWESISPSAVAYKKKEMMRKEALEHGVKGNLDDADWKGFGPASRQLIDMEANRLFRVYQSINEKGYLRRHGLLKASVFISGRSFLVQPLGGWHRVAALVANDYEYIPIMLGPESTFIKREDVKKWGNVEAGFFSESEALTIFDDRFLSLLSGIK